MRTTEVAAPPKVYPGYIFFSLSSLVPGSEAPCTIKMESYNQFTKRLRLVSVLEGGERIEPRWLERVLEQGVEQGYIALNDLEQLQEYLHRQTHLILQNSADEPERGQRLVYENALCSIKAAMLDPKNGRRLSLGVATVRQTLELIWDDDQSRRGLLKVMVQDRQLYNHSLNVCLLGVSFARSLNWSRDECESLGLALFFHDLGLLEPNGQPDAYALCRKIEASTFKRHPQGSCSYLQTVQEASEVVVDTVLNHHENLDGSGFPRGLTGEQLSPLSRLARIVDAYESGTSGCLAHQSQPPFATLRYMRQRLRDQLDQDLLESFVRFLGQS